jgi:hypothetical protein
MDVKIILRDMWLDLEGHLFEDLGLATPLVLGPVKASVHEQSKMAIS